MKAIYFLWALLPLTLAASKNCECALVKCPGENPAKCQCENNAAIECAKRCHKNPATKTCATPTSTQSPKPTSTICGSRGLPQCAAGQTCVADPANPDCSLIADCPGFCVYLDGPMCGGFAGFPCPDAAQVCIDDPRDDCAPPTGADCAGVCVYLDGRAAS